MLSGKMTAYKWLRPVSSSCLSSMSLYANQPVGGRQNNVLHRSRWFRATIAMECQKIKINQEKSKKKKKKSQVGQLFSIGSNTDVI